MKISIIVPVYNSSKYLRFCINSIIAQTYKEWELILVDDGSSDDSLEICKEYSKKDDRIKVFSQSNSGVSSARNKGILESKGDYICFVDSDDQIEVDFLEVLIDRTFMFKYDLIICGYRTTGGKSYYLKDNKDFDDQKEIFNFILENYLTWIASAPWGRLYRRRNINFDQNLTYGEDLKYNIEYIIKTQRMCILNYIGYIYNVNNDNAITKKYNKLYFDNIYSIHKFILNYIDNMKFDKDNVKMYYVNYKLISALTSYILYIVKKYNNSIVLKKILTKICKDIVIKSAINKLPRVNIFKSIYYYAIKSESFSLLYIISNIVIKSRRIINK